MAKSQILPGWLFPIPGLFLQTFGLFSGDIELSLAGSGLLAAGLALYIRGKGYHPAWGLWGVVPLLGPILVFLQPDRHARPAARMRGGAGLLAIMAVLGLAFTLICPQLVSGNFHLWPKPEPPATPPPVVVQLVQAQPEPTPAPQPPAPQPPPPPPAPANFEEAYGQVKPGMTCEDVVSLVGNDMLIVGTSKSMRIVRWRGGDRQAFTARFKDGKLDLKSRLQKPIPPLPPAAQDESLARAAKEANREPDLPEPEPSEDQQPAEDPPAGQTDLDQDPEPLAEEQQLPEETGVVTAQAKSERVVRVASKLAERKPRPSVRKARLPRSSGQIDRGANDVIFINRSENTLRVGVRLGRRGADFDIPPGGHHTLFLSNGSYSVYYIDLAQPETLHAVRSVRVDSPPVAIEVAIPR
jgi:hypothetical protein